MRRYSLTRLVQARARMLIALALAIVVGIVLPSTIAPIARALVAWNTFVYVYLTLIWILMARADPRRLQRLAALMDETAQLILVLVMIGAVMSLLAIVAELATAKDLVVRQRLFHFVLTGATVLGSWALVPTVFALHYAYMFYRDTAQPQLHFPDDEKAPTYVDFMYFSFTIAVASATADISIQSRELRRLVLVQAILSFFFNASVVALSVNIAASLAFPGG